MDFLIRHQLHSIYRRLRSSVPYSVLATALSAAGTAETQAASYTVSSEAEFISAINSIAGDGDPDGTIMLTGDATISAASTIPSANKNLIIDTTGGYNLIVNADMPHTNTLDKIGDGNLIFAGQNGPQGRVNLLAGSIEFTDGAQNDGGAGSRYLVGQGANSTTSLVVSGAGTYVETGVGSRFGGGSDATTTIRIEDGGTLKSNSTTGINSQTVGTTGGNTFVEVTGQDSLFETGRLNSGLRGGVSYRITDGGQMATGTTDLGGNVVNVGFGDHVLISGAGSNWTSSGVFQFHDGTLAVMDGGALTSSELLIAPSGGRVVEALVSGVSTSISTTTGDVSIGAAFGTYDGTGVLTVSNGGSISSVGGTGDIVIAGGAQGSGTLNVGGAEGHAAAEAGNISAANIVLGAGSATVNFNHFNTNYQLDSVLMGSGTVNQVASGTTVLSGANTYAGSTNVLGGVLRAGAASALSAASDYTIGGSGTLDLDGFDQTIASLDNGGKVAFGSTLGTTLSIAGDYTGAGGVVEISTVLGDDASDTDLLHVAGDTFGASTLKVTNVGGAGAQTVEGIKVVQVDGSSNGSFTLQGDYILDGEQAVIAGAYSYGLYQNGVSTPADGDWYLRSILSSAGTPTFQPGVPIYESYSESLQSFNALGTLQQRVGNRSWSMSDDAVATGLIEGRGVWGRIDGYRANYVPKASTSDAEYVTSAWKLQIGVDEVLHTGDSGDLIGGIYFHYGTGSTDVSAASGDGDIKSSGYGLGGTLTWYSDTQFYFDGQAQATWYVSDLSSATTGNSLITDNDGFGFAASVEAGQKLDLSSNWSVTPQAQLMHSSVSHDSFVDAYGAAVSLDESKSLIGRLGLSADYQESDETKKSRTHIYGIANLYHDFAGGSKTTVSGVTLASERHSTWVGVGIGGSHNGDDDRYSIYGELNMSTGLANFGESSNVKATFGMRAKW